MNNYYKDKEGFADQVKITKHAIEELEKFSIYNDDMYQDEILEAKHAIERLDIPDSCLKGEQHEHKYKYKEMDWKDELIEIIGDVVGALERLEIKN